MSVSPPTLALLVRLGLTLESVRNGQACSGNLGCCRYRCAQLPVDVTKLMTKAASLLAIKKLELNFNLEKKKKTTPNTFALSSGVQRVLL